MRSYFCGWYFRCQSDRQTLAIIPAYHITRHSSFCSIQMITESESFYTQYPFSDFEKDRKSIRIADSFFREDGIKVQIETAELHAVGELYFGDFSPIQYDIMGPFQYVPFMQCRHSVFSMRHLVSGEIILNGVPYVFRDGIGYMEGDRGYSFPRKYAWTQCSFSDGALMLSLAEIPFGAIRFTGVVGILLLRGKEYRIATYLGAKVVKVSREEIIVRQRNSVWIVRPQKIAGQPLRAPISGAMKRTIHEHLSSRIIYRFEHNGTLLLELDAPNGAFEYEY